MKRLLFTFKLLAILLVVDACLKCDDVLPYFDFQEMSFHYRNGKEIYVEQDFVLIVSLDDVSYLANVKNNFSLIPSAVATEPCPRNGYDGIKHPLDSIRIVSHANWDSTHQAGSHLNDLFYVEQWWDYDGESHISLPSNQGIPIVENKSTVFQIRTSPTEDLKHVFQLTYYKSNGEIVEGTTDTITWVP